MDGEGRPGPDVHVGTGLVIGVPPDPGVPRRRTGSGVLVDHAELLVVEQPGIGAEQASGHFDQYREMDQGVSGRRGHGGEADVVGEGPAVDGGIGVVEDHGAVPRVEPSFRQLVLGPDHFDLGLPQEVGIDGTPQGGVALVGEEGHQLIDIFRPEDSCPDRPPRLHAHRGGPISLFLAFFWPLHNCRSGVDFLGPVPAGQRRQKKILSVVAGPTRPLGPGHLLISRRNCVKPVAFGGCIP